MFIYVEGEYCDLVLYSVQNLISSALMYRYPQMNEEDFTMACPVCRDNCNCTRCLRLELPLHVCFFSTLT